MARYNVQVILSGGGPPVDVPVDADNLAEARRKALDQFGPEERARARTPVLVPESSPSSGLRERLPGESTNDYLRYRAGLDPVGSSAQLSEQELNPDLYETNSSTFVPPQNFTNFAETLGPNNNLSVEDLNPDLFDVPENPWVSSFVEDAPQTVDERNPPAVAATGFNNNPALQAEIDRLTALGLSRQEAFDAAITAMQTQLDDLNAQINNQLSNVGPDATNQGVPGAVAGSLPFDLSDQDLFNISPDAGYQRAFGNVFGNEVTSAGPLSGYFDRQRQGLTGAFQAKSLVDYLNNFQRDQALYGSAGGGGLLEGPVANYGTAASGVTGTTAPGAVGPGAFDPNAAVTFPSSNPLQGQFVPQSGSFENFIRQTQAAPTGLNSAYTNALQNYQNLRGLSASQAPESLSYLFSPEQFNDVQNSYGLLRAAQRGKYSPLVSNLFRTPSYEKVFGDYTLASQDRAKQGLGAGNFLDFAGSGFGL